MGRYLDVATIHDGARHVVYRARTERGGPTLVLKVIKAAAQRKGESMLERERDLLRQSRADGVVAAVGLDQIDHVPTLVLADAGTRTLADLLRMRRRLDIATFFALAIPIAAIVARIHGRGVIHRDINPSNFVLDETDHPTLIDFSLATSVVGRANAGVVAEQLEGTLAYIAPEQTGRADRLVDQRADLYSLGATLFEMLTGGPPFRASTPLELVHAHLAQKPASPARIARVPRGLSDIVLKLLAKMPEERYQSAEALIADLLEAQRRWQRAKRIDAFELGRVDLARMLPIPERMYGREKERALLDEARERVFGGAREIVLVSGSAGVGKTTLVEDLRARFEARGLVMSGKCDELWTNVPYGALTDAINRCLDSLARRPGEIVDDWRRRLLEALGPNARVLTDVISSLRRLLGEQPPVAALGPVETENRLRLTLRAFFRALATRDRPLMIFLDDLQWADSASIAIVGALAHDPGIRHLLFVGAYRREEVGAEHPLRRELERLQSERVELRVVDLGPLDADLVTSMVAESLRCSPDRAAPFARVVVGKTAGNPFFITRFLRYLQRAEILEFDTAKNRWTWDLLRVEQAPISDNVVDLLSNSVRRLPRDTQRALSTAACIGHRFDPALVATVLDESQDEAGRAFWPAIHEGLLLPLSATHGAEYMFAHDKVRESIHALLDDAEKQRLHLRIGCSLLDTLAPEELGERLFAVVDQINAAGPIAQCDGSPDLGSLNFRAGRNARASAAFESGLGYFRRAIEIWGTDAWRTRPEQTFRAHRDAAECAFLAGRAAEGDALIETALAHAPSKREKAALHALCVMDRSIRGSFAEALEWGRRGLGLLAIDVPRSHPESAIGALMIDVRSAFAGRPIDEFLALPDAHEQDVVAALALLNELVYVAWHSDPGLFAVLVLQITLLSVRDGLSPASAIGFVGYAMVLARAGEYELAYAIGRMALRLCDRFPDPSERCKVLMIFSTFINQWRAPMRDAGPMYTSGNTLAMQSGNLLWASNFQFCEVLYLYGVGADLGRVSEAVDSTLTFSRLIDSPNAIAATVSVRQAVRSLRGLTSIRGSLDDDEFDGAQFVREMAPLPPHVANYFILRLQVEYMLRDFEAARASMASAAPLVPFLQTHYPEPIFVLFAAMTLLEHGDLEGARTFERKLALWAENCPANFQHRHWLVLAEMARVEGQPFESVRLYERAIEAARREGFVQDEALAQERCGRLLHARGVPRMAMIHLATARERYGQWGADAKVQALDEEFPELLAEAAGERAVARPESQGSIDASALIGALETLSSELVPEKLIEHLLRIGLQLAGAQRGVLVLAEENSLFVRASAGTSESVTLEHTPLAESRHVSVGVVEHVHRTNNIVALADSSRQGEFTRDPYIAEHRIRSVLAIPATHQRRFIGVLYFENNLATHAFTPDRVQGLRLLSTEMAISLENSFFFERLRVEVQERTRAEAAMRFLADTSSVLSESIDYEATMAKVARLLLPLGDGCTVTLVDEDGSVRPVARAHTDPVKEQLLLEMQSSYSPSEFGFLPSMHVMRSGEHVLEPTVTDATLRKIAIDDRSLELLRGLRLRSYLAVPLVARERSLGAITLMSSSRSYGMRDLSLIEDVARRAALAIDNARLYRNAQDAIRLRDEFIAVASHELRTPLTPITMQIQMIARILRQSALESIPCGKDVLRLLERANERLGALDELVETLLDTSSIDADSIALNFETVDMNALIRRVADRHSAMIHRSGSRLELQLQPDVSGVWDSARIEQVVVNLLRNAIKYGAGKPIAVVSRQDDQTVEIRIRDHGIGIRKEDQSRIFERFGRAVSVHHFGGFGVGLFVADQIVTAHGGTISVESELGTGSTFTVRLPRREPQRAKPDTTTPTPRRGTAK